MEQIKADNISIDVKILWVCPKCKHKWEEEFNQNPYESVANSGLDVYCKDCKEFYTIEY